MSGERGNRTRPIEIGSLLQSIRLVRRQGAGRYPRCGRGGAGMLREAFMPIRS